MGVKTTGYEPTEELYFNEVASRVISLYYILSVICTLLTNEFIIELQNPLVNSRDLSHSNIKHCHRTAPCQHDQLLTAKTSGSDHLAKLWHLPLFPTLFACQDEAASRHLCGLSAHPCGKPKAERTPHPAPV